jgi:hypothetical protein
MPYGPFGITHTECLSTVSGALLPKIPLNYLQQVTFKANKFLDCFLFMLYSFFGCIYIIYIRPNICSFSINLCRQKGTTGMYGQSDIRTVCILVAYAGIIRLTLD